MALPAILAVEGVYLMPPRRPLPDSEDTPATILLNIYERLGRVENQFESIVREHQRAADGRSKIYASQDEVLRRLDRIDGENGLASKVKAMEPSVKSWEQFRKQLALAAIGVSALVSGALGLLWLAFTNIGEIKGAMKSVLSWVLDKP